MIPRRSDLPPRRVGRPPLPSTCFLEEAVRDGAYLAGLYAVWRQMHRETMCYELYDPARSFRAAIASARRRIERNRA